MYSAAKFFLLLSQLLDEAASDAEDVELLMLASQWAGAAYVQQVLIEKSRVSYNSFAYYVRDIMFHGREI